MELTQNNLQARYTAYTILQSPLVHKSKRLAPNRQWFYFCDKSGNGTNT